jgi:hypothetical protein
LGATHGRAQPQYDVLYDPATGNVTIDSLDPNLPLRSIRFNSPGNQLNPANLNSVLPLQLASLTPPPTSDQIYIVGLQPVTPAQAAQIDSTVAPYVAGTRWDMGDILPKGLDARGLDDAIPNARFHPVTPSAFYHLNRVVVPEPASLSLVALGGLAVMRRRPRVG